MSNFTRIGILEDHLMIQQYLRERVEKMKPQGHWEQFISADRQNFTLSFVVDTFDKLKAKLRNRDSVPPDILLLDLLFDQTDHLNGKDVAMYLDRNFPQIKVIVISDLVGEMGIKESLMKIRNVKFCLSKREVVTQRNVLEDTIKKVRDEAYKSANAKTDSPKIATKMDGLQKHFEVEISDAVAGYELSMYKKPILALLAKGKTRREIAAHLEKSQTTIDKHISEMCVQFEVSTTEGLITKAIFMNVLRFQ